MSKTETTNVHRVAAMQRAASKGYERFVNNDDGSIAGYKFMEPEDGFHGTKFLVNYPIVLIILAIFLITGDQCMAKTGEPAPGGSAATSSAYSSAGGNGGSGAITYPDSTSYETVGTSFDIQSGKTFVLLKNGERVEMEMFKAIRDGKVK